MQSVPWSSCSTRQFRIQLLLCYYSSLPRSHQFHSSPVSFAKWKAKWDSKHDNKEHQRPSKSYMKYVTRHKRAEAKKALKNYLLYGKTSPLIIKDEEANSSNNLSDIPRFRSSGKSRHRSSSQSQRGYYSGRNGWQNNQWFSGFQDEEEFVNPESIFEEMFGESRGFTWSFSSWQSFCNSRYGNSTHGSRFTDKSRRKGTKEKDYFSETDAEESDSSFNPFVGSSTNRAALGLPTAGPLKIEDVKIAFRAAALKWHPDRHTGPSQATAAEKFKLCVNAYQSLCSDLGAN